MWDKIPNQNYYNSNEEKMNKRKKKIIKLLVLFVSISILLGIFGSIAYKAGFIPIKRFMGVKKPIGDAEEINIDEHIKKYPEIRKFPYLDKLKYKVYVTNKSKDVVANDYKKKLKDDGYKILYEGIVYREEAPFEYYGFLKGFSAVGIIMTSDKNFTLNHETIVLYTTGSAFDYREIYRWYQENKELFGDIYS